MESPRLCSKLPESAGLCRTYVPVRCDLLTIPEFCSSVRISTRQFFRVCAEGIGPRRTYLGGKVMITQQSMKQWLDERTEV